MAKSEIVSDHRLHLALTYLAETDELCARAKAFMDGLRDRLKTVEAIGYLKSSGAVKERESEARATGEYKAHLKDIEDATVDYEIMRLKRSTNALLVDVWRTCQSNRRAGII